MKHRLFILFSLITLLIVGACTGPAQEQSDQVSSSGASSREETAQMEEPEAEPVQITTTEEAMAEAETPAMPESPEVESLSPETQPPPAASPTPAPDPTEPPVEAAQTQPVETEPSILLQGQFQDADEVHTGTGTATIYQRPDGSYLLTFEEFEVCCGPELYVFLATNPAPTGHADLGDYLELSSLQASSGNQEYEIPAGADLSETKSVVIYCKPFEVIISTATLS